MKGSIGYWYEGVKSFGMPVCFTGGFKIQPKTLKRDILGVLEECIKRVRHSMRENELRNFLLPSFYSCLITFQHPFRVMKK